MTSEDLRFFAALLQTRSLVGAAAALAVDRTTVGRRLDQLEARLGTSLFLRSKSGLQPTGAAMRLGDQAERILRELRELETTVVATDTAVRGVVRIATTEGFAGHMIRRGLLNITTRYPELVIELHAGNLVVDLDAGEADVALRTAATRGEGIRVRKIATLSIGLAASAEYLRARGMPADLDDLAGHDVLVPTGELARVPEAKLLSRAKGVRIVMRSPSVPALVEAARTNMGIVPIPGAWAEAAALVRIMPLPQIPPRPLWLAIAAGQRERPAVRVVSDEIARLFADFH
jgi:DNA-binding transcriptional LysR family regulator